MEIFSSTRVLHAQHKNTKRLQWRGSCDLNQTGCHGDHMMSVVSLRGESILAQNLVFTCGVVCC